MKEEIIKFLYDKGLRIPGYLTYNDHCKITDDEYKKVLLGYILFVMKDGNIQQNEVIEYFNEINKVLPSMIRDQKLKEGI